MNESGGNKSGWNSGHPLMTGSGSQVGFKILNLGLGLGMLLAVFNQILLLHKLFLTLALLI
jgi:hypothetical protein